MNRKVGKYPSSARQLLLSSCRIEGCTALLALPRVTLQKEFRDKDPHFPSLLLVDEKIDTSEILK
jgi:hypothetical protein